MYKNSESLCYIPETNIMCVNYNSTKTCVNKKGFCFTFLLKGTILMFSQFLFLNFLNHSILDIFLAQSTLITFHLSLENWNITFLEAWHYLIILFLIILIISFLSFILFQHLNYLFWSFYFINVYALTVIMIR